MKYPNHSLARALSLGVLLGAVLWLPGVSLGKEEPKVKEEPIKDQVKKDDRAPKGVPVPDHPLRLNDTKAGDPTFKVDGADTPNRFNDYRWPSQDLKSRAIKADLPLFGIDFFEPARQIILAHRAYVKRQYGLQNEGSGLRSSQNGGKPISANSPEAKTDAAQAKQDSASTIIVVPPTSEDASAASKSVAVNTPTNSDVEKKGIPYAESDDPDTVRRSENLRVKPEPVNAYEEVADPLSQLYRNVTATVPPNYKLAPGDTLTIRYWSKKQEIQTLTRAIDSQGSISLGEFEPVILRGTTLEQAEKAIRAHLRRYYNGVEVSVTLGKLRTVSVMVSGRVFQQGNYVVPAVATAYNLLYAAGGPLSDGSLRNIELRREGRLIGTMDIYRYLMIGGQANDFSLQSGDHIYVPPRMTTVTVMGEVGNPARFELLREETLKDALRYAGDVKPSAVDQRVQINTLVPGTARVLKDIDLKVTTAGNTRLYDGDVVDVFSVRGELTNQVSIIGAVDQPSDYALAPGMRVSDLVQRARGVMSDAFLPRADLFRWNPDNTTTLVPIELEKALNGDPKANVVLSRWDRLKIYTREEVAWAGQRKIALRGAVRRPGLYALSTNMVVSDLLRMAGGLNPDAYIERAVLLHQNGDGTYAMEYIRLADLERGDRSKEPALQDNDILAIYRIGEAQFEPERMVSIQGEVVSPGPFPRTEGMRLTDLLKLSGGFKPSAGARVVVAHARRAAEDPKALPKTVAVMFNAQRQCAPQDDMVLEDGDLVTVQGVGGFVNEVQYITIAGAVNNPGPIILSRKNMRLSDALKEAGGLRPEAFPQGVEFARNPRLLSFSAQRNIADTVSKLNDILNENTYNRERGKAFLERIKAAATATQTNAAPLSGGANSPVNPTANALTNQLAQQDTVSPPRKLSDGEIAPNGNIAVDLAAALKRPGSADDPILMHGDTISIPEKPTTVFVTGAVINGRAILYKPGASIDYYLAQAGGIAPDAARDRIVVIHAGGGLIPVSKVRRLEAGDTILVPTRVLAERISNNQNFLDTFFRSVTSSFFVFRLFGL